MHPVVVRRSSFLLLEVMIAFLLVALCLIPLLKPHYAMLRSDQTILDETKLEHVVQKLYAKFLVQLYQGDISWSEVGHFDAPVPPVDINSDELEGLPYTASYTLRITPYRTSTGGERRRGELSKPPKAPREQQEHHLFQMTYTFLPKDNDPRNKKEFIFRLYVQRPQEAAVTPAPATPAAATSAAKKN